MSGHSREVWRRLVRSDLFRIPQNRTQRLMLLTRMARLHMWPKAKGCHDNEMIAAARSAGPDVAVT
jgi:hypothetical protein